MKKNMNIVLAFGLVLSFNAVFAVIELSNSSHSENKYNGDYTIIEKVVTTEEIIKSDGTETTTIIETSPTGEVLSSKSEVSVDENIKAIGYVHEAIVAFMGQAEDLSLVIAKVISFYAIDINKPIKDGVSLIHLLVTNPSEKERAFALMLPGIDFKAKTSRGHTVRDLALLAADKNKNENTKYALDAVLSKFNLKITNIPTAQEFFSILNFFGIDINKSIPGGIAPIHLVAFASSKDPHLSILDIPGINLEAKTSRGHTALDLARLAGNTELAKLLEKALAKQKKS